MIFILFKSFGDRDDVVSLLRNILKPDLQISAILRVTKPQSLHFLFLEGLGLPLRLVLAIWRLELHILEGLRVHAHAHPSHVLAKACKG